MEGGGRNEEGEGWMREGGVEGREMRRGGEGDQEGRKEDKGKKEMSGQEGEL